MIDCKGTTYNPLVSIITPVLNNVKRLGECIESVLNQSYPYIEHVLVDGGSTDGTLDMLSSYQAKYPDRIRLTLEPGTGIGEALNEGLRMAKGEILGGLMSDDLYQPDAVQKVVEFFKANPGAYFVYGSHNVIDEKGELIRVGKTRDVEVKDLINKGNYFTFCSAFNKREVVEKVGWFENLIGSDRDYWIRVGMVFPMHRIENVLSSFRSHPGSATTGMSIEIRRKHMRAGYLITRRHGGGIFSYYCRVYYRFLIIEGLRPILGFAYPWIKKVLRK